MQRLIFFIACILLLIGCATSHSQESITMPKEFLGDWNNYSANNKYSLHIRPDGIIEVYDEKNGDIMQSINYRVIKIINPTDIYIAAKNFGHEDATTFMASNQGYFYAHLYITEDNLTKGTYLEHYTAWLPVYESWQKHYSVQNWDTMTSQEHWESVHEISNPRFDFTTGVAFIR